MGKRGKKKKLYIANRNYKDTLFRMLFSRKKELLILYNAINHSNYDDPEQLEITTIETAIYIGVKNDVSFLIDSFMNLYEAQSTRNPNMPLRGLIYFSHVYQAYIEKWNLNIFGDYQVFIPTPRYIVFYNGKKNEPERKIYRLSDAFQQKQERYCLECEATVLNINAGFNQELMEHCRLLYEYSTFVGKVRDYLETHPHDLDEAMDLAVEECIRDGILTQFLKRHKAEVKTVILEEYDREKHIKAEKLESYESGRNDGYNEGHTNGYNEGRNEELKELIKKKLTKGKTVPEIADALEKDIDTIETLIRQITNEENI